MELDALFSTLGIDAAARAGGDLVVRSPGDGSALGRLQSQSPATVVAAVDRAETAFRRWREVPAPRRGELVRLLGEELRARKTLLGELVTRECGKILAEGEGEVQEMIDICDFALGLSRQLYGRTMTSERPGHRMMETWHPLGPIGVITAFNFPVAVWSWNAALALVCGDTVVWKPSEKTPLTALACGAILDQACARFGEAPAGLLQIVIGNAEIGQAVADDPRLALISATGSSRMGRRLGPRVAARLGRSILELGGNNAMIVAPSADLELALRAIVFAAVGTAGQRCTTLRRVIVHESIRKVLVERLKTAYAGLRVGDPLDPDVLVGPLIDEAAFLTMQETIAKVADEGGAVHGGQRLLAETHPDCFYVAPALVEMPGQTETVRRETFASILYVLGYRDFSDAVALHNDVPQGLSSCIFTGDMREAELFLSSQGSDCGLANVNIGPSGAEIGGAFGGEKDTGGGREAGSDTWKAYMRRATNTINYSRELPLAQGIEFGQG